MKMIHRGEKGFTLIELLVVVAILGVIAAVVALNIGSFFGQGTVQSANTELHQVQTAIISSMAECESGTLYAPADNVTAFWAGGNGTITAPCTRADGSNDASFYVYGPFRAAYQIDHSGRILLGTCNNSACGDIIGNPWSGIVWDSTNRNWISS